MNSTVVVIKIGAKSVTFTESLHVVEFVSMESKKIKFDMDSMSLTQNTYL